MMAIISRPPENGDTAENSGLEKVFKIKKANNINGVCHAQISVYWRLDDIDGLENIDSLHPTFAVEVTKGIKYRPLIRTLLLDDNYTAIEVKDFYANGYNSTNVPSKYELSGLMDSERLISSEFPIDEMIEALTFSGSSAANAKYLYMQMGLELLDCSKTETFDIYFGTYGLKCKGSCPLDEAYIKIVRNEIIRNPIQLAGILCKDNGIDIDIEEASLEIASDIYETNSEMPSIEVANGARWEEKLSELCRAANFSLFSDGSKLHAKYWAKDRDKEIEWVINEKSIVANSYDITSPENGYIATDYAFSVQTDNGAEAFNFFAADKNTDFQNGWEYSEDIEFGGNMSEAHRYDGACMLPISAPGNADIHSQYLSLMLGNLFEINYNGRKGIFRLLDMRCFSYMETYCIFEYVSGEPVFANSATGRAIIKSVKKKEFFGGNYPIDISSAEWLFQRAQSALEITKKHIKMDERYTKHKAMAFTKPETWLKSILNTVAHNTYKKALVKFSVPLDMLPAGDLHELMLMRARLEFGWFRKRPICGWIIGYSLNPGKDAADLTFLSSEPMKDAKWYDENYLEEPIVLDETEANPDRTIEET